MTRSLFPNRLAEVLIAWLPFLVAFVMIPFAIYLSNQGEFDYDVGVILPFLGVAAVGLVLISTLALLPAGWRVRVARVMFCLGLFLFISDIIAPVQIESLDGRPSGATSTVPEPISLSIAEGALALFLVVFIFRVKFSTLRSFGVVFVSFLIVSQVVTVFYDLSDKTVISALNASERAKISKKMLADRPSRTDLPNVYQIVFDGYSSSVFLDSLYELKLDKELSGFTFFKNNRANYANTYVSVPSFLTGVPFSGGEFKKWRNKSITAGLAQELHDAGYTISTYAADKSYFSEHTAFGRTNIELMSSIQEGGPFLTLAEIWLIRVAPNFLQNELLSAGVRSLTAALVWLDRPIGVAHSLHGVNKLFYLKMLVSVPLMREFIRDEESRSSHGQYVYAHFIIPHTPFNWEADCTWAKGWSDYQRQASCTTKLMGEFLNELKRLGRFHNSLIIIQSDHGSHNAPSDSGDKVAIPLEVIRKVDSKINGFYSAEGFLNRTKAVLLIKPPREKNAPFRVSSTQTQLLDIPRTVVDSVGLSDSTFPGRSVFSIPENELRSVDVFAGFIRLNKQGHSEVFGKHFDEVELGHLQFNAESGWKVLSDIRVTAGDSGN